LAFFTPKILLFYTNFFTQNFDFFTPNLENDFLEKNGVKKLQIGVKEAQN